MRFKSYFYYPNKTLGCLVSESFGDTVQSAIDRTLYDAGHKSPWNPDEVIVLQIRDVETDEILFSKSPEADNLDFKRLLGM